MEKKQNHVGRPSNQEVAKRNSQKNKKILLFVAIFIVVVSGLFTFINKDKIDFSDIKGDSASSPNRVLLGGKTYKVSLSTAGTFRYSLSLNKRESIRNCKTSDSSVATCTIKFSGTYASYSKYTMSLKVYKPGTIKIYNDVISRSGKTKTVSNNYVFTLKYDSIIVDGSKYYVLKNAKEFRNYVQSNKFYQSAKQSVWGDSCLGFSQVYINAIYKNKFDMIENQSGLNNGNSPTLYDIKQIKGASNHNKDTVLKAIYNKFSIKVPVVLQVNGNKAGTSRHYVAVIGYKVSDFNNRIFKESSLLILDVWDGKIESLRGKGSGSRFMTKGTETGSGKYGYQIYHIIEK